MPKPPEKKDDSVSPIVEDSIVSSAISREEGERAASVIRKAIKTDPVLKNELSQERWWQSGIQWFGTGGVLTALGFLAMEIGTNGVDFDGYNWGLVASSAMSLFVNLGVLYRRFAPGLKPFFWWVET